jgi:hypothetical protein
MGDSTLIITIGGNADKFAEALKDVQSKTENLQSQLSTLTKISAVAFAALTTEIGFAVAAYKESEKSVNQLTTALQNQGVYSKQTLNSYQDISESLMELTGVSDEAITNAQVTIQAYLGQTKVTEDLTLAVMNLAAAKKMDLASAAEIVGKAIDGNTTMLKRYGLEIADNLTKNERLAAIIDVINGKWRDQAKAAAEGLGTLSRLRQIFDNLQEVIGSKFAPMITKASEALISFIKYVKDNEQLMNLVASFLAAGVAVSGLVMFLGLAAKAFVLLNGVLIAAKIEMTALSLATKAFVGATGLGLIILVLAELYLNWKDIWPRMQTVFEVFTNNVGGKLAGLSLMMIGLFSKNIPAIREGWNKLKDSMSQSMNDYNVVLAAKLKEQERAEKESEERKLNQNDKGAADREAKKRLQEAREIEYKKAALELQLLQEQGATKELIALKQKEADALKLVSDETFKGDKQALTIRAAELRELQKEQYAQDRAAFMVYQEDLLLDNDEFMTLNAEQKQLFIEQNQASLMEGLESERSIQMEMAKQRANEQKKANNQFLIDQAKFGAAYAAINKMMHSEIYQGTKTAFGEMAEMQNSSNSTLKAIGKVATIANIIIKTNESAMNVYAGFSTIPFVGTALGIAAAAAVYAYGAERVGAVNAAAAGGLAEGGIPGVDSIPFLLQQGELVTPRKNFDEVVTAVADQRNREGEGAGSGVMEVVIGFKDNAFEIIEQKIIERRATGLSAI